ncbi:Fructose-bisphosphate aldolase, cytoplasmic isozyme [Triticum urartu]|uniref:Fructose-bisphosphate aldolase n=1 Tax=Triticum urartu TaxID=4572 RepID=M7ZYB3_TRIUA|nr:Fructose-bisphosphate aldolase, cytoplasmic isozyme [Triticum urartu]
MGKVRPSRVGLFRAGYLMASSGKCERTIAFHHYHLLMVAVYVQGNVNERLLSIITIFSCSGKCERTIAFHHYHLLMVAVYVQGNVNERLLSIITIFSCSGKCERTIAFHHYHLLMVAVYVQGNVNERLLSIITIFSCSGKCERTIAFHHYHLLMVAVYVQGNVNERLLSIITIFSCLPRGDGISVKIDRIMIANLSYELIKNAAYIGTPGKGILAADESTGTIGKRFASINVENVEDNRRALRELLFCTPGALQYLSGVILFEKTLYQSTKGGKPFVDILKAGNVLPGIKVDKGTIELARTNGETTTQGFDDLALASAAPSTTRLVTEIVLAACYKALNDQHVLLEGTLLKPNMVTPGSDAKKVAPEVIAEYTVRTHQRTVPAAVPAIVFLSGGQSVEEATLNLNAMNKLQTKKPWNLSFSFGRALQQSTLKAWSGKAENEEKARAAFLVRCKANSEATLGTYKGVATLGEGASESLHVTDCRSMGAATVSGDDLLEKAAEKGLTEAMKCLLESGANPNVPNAPCTYK